MTDPAARRVIAALLEVARQAGTKAGHLAISVTSEPLEESHGAE